MPPRVALEPALRALGDRAGQGDQGRAGGPRHPGAQLQRQPRPRALGGAARRRRALQGVHAVLAGLGRARPLPAPLPAPARSGRPVEPDRTRWPLGAAADRPGLGGGLARDLGAGRARGLGRARRVRRRAHRRLQGRGRDYPAEPGVSRLSPRLHHGELSPRQVWHGAQVAVRCRCRSRSCASWSGASSPITCCSTSPQLPDTPLRPEFARFPWSDDAGLFRAWCRGRTGYPLVDAGMRELWHTGYMHNRVRMIVASFLTKDLLIPWQKGAAWFWDTLCDADLANNSRAGSGSPAAAPTPPPISASSTPSARRPSSTPPAPMCAAGCRSSPGCRQSSSTTGRGPGRCAASGQCAARPELSAADRRPCRGATAGAGGIPANPAVRIST